MSIIEMKLELIKAIVQMEDQQVEEAYGFLLNHFNSQLDEWDEPFSLSEIDNAIKESDENLGTPLQTVMNRLRNKYGING